MKRLLTLVLTLSIVLSLLPLTAMVPTAQAADTAVANAVITAFDAYAAKLKQSNSANDCVDAMLYPAMFGDGSAKSFGEKDAITAALYGSALFREFMVQSLPAAIRQVQDLNQRKALMGGQPSWYNSAMYYALYDYLYNDTADVSDDQSYLTLVPRVQYTGSVNRNDQALMLVAGSTECRIHIKQVWASNSQLRYRIDVTVADTFDFSGSRPAVSSSGFNTVYIKMLNAMGKLLRLKSYPWTSKSSFEVTVPNLCAHVNGNYRWEESGGELVSISGDGLLRNDVTKIARNLSADTTPQYYYGIDQTIYLYHDQPWTVSFSTTGTSAFSLNPVPNYSGSYLPALLKRGTSLYGSYCEFRRETSATTGKQVTHHKRHQYGLNCADFGIPASGYHTYLLENRIAEDGSNMVWLTVDGTELGQLRQHSIYDSKTQSYEYLSDTPPWFSGKDFIVNYLFSSFSGFSTTMPVQYLEIRPGGDGDFRCVTTRVTEASCTAAAVETSTCSLCGGSWTREIAPALGHTEEAIPGTAATCTESGLTEGKKCTVCGETTAKQEAIPALGHTEETVPGKDPTCLEEGLSDGKHCTRCGQTTVNQQILPAAGHTPEAVAGKAPTCLEAGLSDGSRCAVCGETLTLQEAIPATGHTEGPMVEKAPTCTESGLTGGTACTVCGTVLTPQETVPALPHTEQPLPGKAPTCTEPGLTEGIACAVCGQTITAQEAIPAPGHSWDAGTVTTEPTATDPGVMTYICTVCGAERTEEIPAMGETILWGDVNGDGFVDSFDASLIMKYDVLLIGDDALNLSAADVSGDGFVDSYDASLILKFDVLLIDKFPAEV